MARECPFPRIEHENRGAEPVAQYQYAPLNQWVAPACDLTKPARKQVANIQTKALQAPEGANEYNIWYHRFVGEHWYDRLEKEAAETRCILARDSGTTKGDSRDKAWFCLHFARGCCAMGSQCTYLHRLPGPQDESRVDFLHDCFGRERHKTDRDDMQGTGNFNRDCKTLYIGGLRSRSGHNIEESIFRHFSEWGPIEKYRVIHGKNLAFLTYYYRCSAEFAKEAMQNQTMDNDELLTVRWAYDDPNPTFVEERKDRDLQEALHQIHKSGVCMTPSEFHYPADYQLQPGAKRQRTDGDPTSAYPDTSEQFDPYGYLAGDKDKLVPKEVNPAGPASKAELKLLKEQERIRSIQSKFAGILDSLPELPAGAEAPPPTDSAAEGQEDDSAPCEPGVAAAAAYRVHHPPASKPVKRTYSNRDDDDDDCGDDAPPGEEGNPDGDTAPTGAAVGPYTGPEVPTEAFGEASGGAEFDYQAVYEAYLTQYPPDVAHTYTQQYLSAAKTQQAVTAGLGDAYAAQYAAYAQAQQQAHMYALSAGHPAAP